MTINYPLSWCFFCQYIHQHKKSFIRAILPHFIRLGLSHPKKLLTQIMVTITHEGLPFNSSMISFHIWLFKKLIHTLQNNVHMLSFPIL
jgi:hypothetical protein